MRMIYRLVHQSSEYCGVLARIARDGSVLSAWHSSRFRQKQEPADRFQQLTLRIMKFIIQVIGDLVDAFQSERIERSSLLIQLGTVSGKNLFANSDQRTSELCIFFRCDGQRCNGFDNHSRVSHLCPH